MFKNTQKRVPRNILVTHSSGEFSYRINGHWVRHVGEIPQADYLALIESDHRISKQIIRREFETGRSCVAGSKVIITRKEAAV